MSRYLENAHNEHLKSPLSGRFLRVALPRKDEWLVEVWNAHACNKERFGMNKTFRTHARDEEEKNVTNFDDNG